MSVNLYKSNIQITTHFNSKEFKCPHCGVMKIDTELISKVEKIFSKVNASKCIVSSGYRCPTYDKRENGFAGRHSEGLAMDCIFYDKNGGIIPSKIIICVAYDLGELNGIAKINNNYTHLDNRKGSTYRGDETRGNSSYWINPYSYFAVSKSDVEKYTGTSTVYYTVQKGDTLWKIAQKYYGVGSKYPTIKSLNGLTSDTIYPGQKLRVK